MRFLDYDVLRSWFNSKCQIHDARKSLMRSRSATAENSTGNREIIYRRNYQRRIAVR